MDVHLLDGTYELFRHHFAVPSHPDAQGREIGATRGVVGSVVGMLSDGVTHLGVATDHVIESFRNQMFPGYKTGDGIEPALLEQFPMLEEALRALGVTVWAMVEFEADDALASAAAIASADPRVDRVVVCTPDKDLAQSVSGTRVVQLDRRNRSIRDEQGVIERFGVAPPSIPDYLALTGDTADGIPGLAGWGAKSASTLLARYRHLEAISDDHRDWEVTVRGAARLAASLRDGRDDALLYRELATLRTDAPVGQSVDEWRWRGPGEGFAAMCERLDLPDLPARIAALARR